MRHTEKGRDREGRKRKTEGERETARERFAHSERGKKLQCLMLFSTETHDTAY